VEDTLAPVWYRHSSVPLEAATPYTNPSLEPKYTASPDRDTVALPVTAPPVGKVHTTVPVVEFREYMLDGKAGQAGKTGRQAGQTGRKAGRAGRQAGRQAKRRQPANAR
jgi:hypothetical protein